MGKGIEVHYIDGRQACIGSSIIVGRYTRSSSGWGVGLLEAKRVEYPYRSCRTRNSLVWVALGRFDLFTPFVVQVKKMPTIIDVL